MTPTDDMSLLRSPIILLGTQRSGTTWMGRLLSNLPGVAYWVEPRHVWVRGNAYKPDDVLLASDARPRVIRRIHKTFDAYVRRHGGNRLLEKTPSNCARVPFIHSVYPEARIILIVRDGRSVISSTEQIEKKATPWGKIHDRLIATPPWEWPANAGRLRDSLVARATGRPIRFWGSRPPGWREWVGKYPVHVIRAKQWASTIANAWESCHALPKGNWSWVRYETLVHRPKEELSRVFEELDITDVGDTLERVSREASPERTDKWRERLDDRTLEEIRPSMEPTMATLGYEWDST
ncbi:MAG: sulfotransferase family protein [Phycisphaerales bacterium JB043]